VSHQHSDYVLNEKKNDSYQLKFAVQAINWLKSQEVTFKSSNQITTKLIFCNYSITTESIEWNMFVM
jgi:hypothetical protein